VAPTRPFVQHAFTFTGDPIIVKHRSDAGGIAAASTLPIGSFRAAASLSDSTPTAHNRRRVFIEN
jgi:hypothetical protein